MRLLALREIGEVKISRTILSIDEGAAAGVVARRDSIVRIESKADVVLTSSLHQTYKRPSMRQA
jgi:hypothetical protein